jgi:hypothetical protein
MSGSFISSTVVLVRGGIADTSSRANTREVVRISPAPAVVLPEEARP